MMRSLFSAISGLRAHQTMLDVTANDIANVNTVGFKGDRISFADALSQLQSGGAAGTATAGGTNPSQVGLGVEVAGITSQMTSGAIQSTGNPLDLAIQGSGWFRVAASTAAPVSPLYTRAGDFSTDSNGNLVTSDGKFVLGYGVTAGPPDTINTSGGYDNAITVDPSAKSVAIDANGVVSYVDATGATRLAGQVSLAKFPNDAGLQRASATEFSGGTGTSSGDATVGYVGDNTTGLGTIAPGSLEMSNVDLAQEFTNMITAQRGFEANSRIISTADQMLQDLVNLGR